MRQDTEDDDGILVQGTSHQNPKQDAGSSIWGGKLKVIRHPTQYVTIFGLFEVFRAWTLGKLIRWYSAEERWLRMKVLKRPRCHFIWCCVTSLGKDARSFHLCGERLAILLVLNDCLINPFCYRVLFIKCTLSNDFHASCAFSRLDGSRFWSFGDWL